MRNEILDIARQLQHNGYTVTEAKERLLHLFRINGEICEECGDGCGWYGDDVYPEQGGITMNCSICNPQAD
jgi:hypothetical protein